MIFEESQFFFSFYLRWKNISPFTKKKITILNCTVYVGWREGVSKWVFLADQNWKSDSEMCVDQDPA